MRRYSWICLSVRSRGRAYSLIEVLIAGGILAIGIAGAAMLANTLLMQEASNGFAIRAFNTQEQAARLWQLGLSPGDITNILPVQCSANATSPEPNSIYFGFSSVTTNISGVAVEKLDPLRIVFHSGTSIDGSNAWRTNDVIVVRPTIR